MQIILLNINGNFPVNRGREDDNIENFSDH